VVTGAACVLEEDEDPDVVVSGVVALGVEVRVTAAFFVWLTDSAGSCPAAICT
jgi:hypothetical protein